MKRWWVILVLLLSVGLNVGLLATVAGAWWASRHAARQAAGAPPPQAEAPPQPAEPPGDGAEPGAVAGAPGGGPGAPPEGPPGGGPGGPPGPPVERLADHLGLAGDTRDEFIALQRGLFETLLEARNRRAYLSSEMRRELVASQPDRDHLERLVDELGRVQTGIERATVETILKSRSLLDERQQRLYLQVLDRLRNGGGQRRGLAGQGPGEGPGAGPGAGDGPGPPWRRRAPRFPRPGAGRPPGGEHPSAGERPSGGQPPPDGGPPPGS